MKQTMPQLHFKKYQLSRLLQKLRLSFLVFLGKKTVYRVTNYQFAEENLKQFIYLMHYGSMSEMLPPDSTYIYNAMFIRSLNTCSSINKIKTLPDRYRSRNSLQKIFNFLFRYSASPCFFCN